jgi:hypothetical protein
MVEFRLAKVIRSPMRRIDRHGASMRRSRTQRFNPTKRRSVLFSRAMVCVLTDDQGDFNLLDNELAC